jgi:SAM-dependent methyltransferase
MGAMDYSLVADLYDTYVQTTFDIPFFKDATRKARGEVLELMSGTGRVSIPLIEEGARLVCIDKSAAMLAILKEKLREKELDASIHEMDIRSLSLKQKFNLIFISFQSFSEIYLEKDQYKVLQNVYKHLAPKGMFICTLHNPQVRLRRVDGQLRLWGVHPLKNKQGMLHMLGAENYEPGFCLVHGVEYFEEYDDYGVMKSKKVLDTKFCLIGKEKFEKYIKKIGFKVKALYGNYSYGKFQEQISPYMIFLLTK